MHNVVNGQTYFKNLAAFTPQDFKSMFGHFTTLCMKGLIHLNSMFVSYEMLCAIWYHLYNFKNVKKTHGGVLLLVKSQALLQVTLLHGCFHVSETVQIAPMLEDYI